MAVLVTRPEIEINGDAAMGLEKVAVIDTTPLSTIFPDALLVKVTVALEELLEELLTAGATFAAIQLFATAKRGCFEALFFMGLLFPQMFCRF